jgi:hypothetical protein
MTFKGLMQDVVLKCVEWISKYSKDLKRLKSLFTLFPGSPPYQHN